ncbi:serine/arginine repetitive matrix protein 2-like [Panonychus citri]|uniref:serine/arginine repetitive matrix protein 2-like n=1 Tax=Panonychus citri TaxID=50023 RepID=UPI002308260C|nr:serine/arginine repetitive matrix protein 2-like [Panonychus citri]
MYNGIGLQTPRGSGTNGYVQRNLAHIHKSKNKVEYKTEDDIKKNLDDLLPKPINPEILDHQRKRKIELKCVELEAQLEDEGASQEEIDKAVSRLREKLLAKEAKSKN